MSKINRKKFIKKAGLATLAGATLGCTKQSKSDEGPAIISSKKYKWKMVTTWPPNFPVLGEGCVLFANWMRELTNGRMDIKVFGGGELVPALEAFDAVTSGAVEIGHAASYYWAGRSPAIQFFATVPFGMNAQQVNAWMYSGDGLKLWRELYAKFNLVPMVAGNSGVQMAGWFNREINEISDFKGLKMRMPGLGGKVIEKVGATAVLVPGSELHTSLDRGIIDATEWIGPYHDYLMGFHDIAKYYYAPGWHEPGTTLELFINKRSYDKLENGLKQAFEACSARLNSWMLSEFEGKNNFYLQKLINEENVEIRKLNPTILSILKEKTSEVLSEIIENDQDSKRVYNSYFKFQKQINQWSDLSEKLYHERIR